MTDNSWILIIDDEESIRKSIANYLEDYGYAVKIAKNAEDGLELVKDPDIKIAIVDIRLPQMDGNEFILNAHKLNKGLVFFIHTGSIDYKLNDDLISIGITHERILQKPMADLGIVRQAIDEILNSEKNNG